MLRRYYGKISKLPIDQFTGHDGELVVDDLTGRTYVMDGITLGGHELVGATPRYETSPPTNSIPGALWYDPTSGRLFIYYNSQWVDAAPNSTYNLPTASESTLGGVKVDNTTIVIDEFGVISAIGDGYLSNRLVNGDKTISLDTDGNLTFPQGTLLGYSDPGGFIIDGAADKDVAIYTYSGSDAHGWTFGTDGNLTTPSGMTVGSAGFIGEGYGIQGNVNQRIELASKGVDGGSTLLWAETYDEMGGLVSLVNVDNSGVGFYTGNVSLGPPNIFYFDMDGNLSLPPNSTISSQSADLLLYAEGNVRINSNVFASNFTTPKGSNGGFRFANIATGDDRTGLFHFNLANQLVLQHEGNVGVKVNANGMTEINNLRSVNFNPTNIYASNVSAGNVSAGNLTANIISAQIGNTKGYRFYDPTEGFSSTAIIHNGSLNQIQIVHESNIGFAVLSNGSTVASNTFTFGTNGIITIPNNGKINYSNGQSILNGITGGSGTNTQPSSTPPTSPTDGQLWYDTDSGRIYVYLGDSWVDASPTLISNQYDDTNVAQYLPTDSTIISLKANASTQANSINSIFANIATQTGNANSQQITINSLIANSISQESKINSLRANVNAANSAIITANVGMKSYVDSISTNWISNAAIQAVSINSILANLAAQTGNALVQQDTIDYLLANTVSQQANISSLRANVNAANSAIITANVGMKLYVDSVTTSWIANAAIQAGYINNIYSNLSTQTGNSRIQQYTIDYLLANTEAQQNEIISLRANVVAANSVIGTKSVYSNSNVAAYMPTYSGSIGGTITVGALLQAPQYTKASNATGTVGQICWDSNYIYVCTATNTWKRVALTGGY